MGRSGFHCSPFELSISAYSNLGLFTSLVSKRKRLIRGAIPSLNLPVKSVPVPPVQPRRELVRQQIGLPVPVVYRNLEHFKKKILSLVMKGWSKTEDEDHVVFDLFHAPYILPKFSLSVTTGLNFSVAVYNWFLPDDHSIYNDHKRSVKYTSISSLMSTLEGAQICEGLSIDEHVNAICEDPTPARGSSSVMRHTIPIERQHYEDGGPPFQAQVFIRSENCQLLCDDISCSSCIKQERSLGKMREIKAKQAVEPLKSNAPLSGSSKARLVATVQKQRLVCKELEGRIAELEKEIKTNSIPIDETMEKDILAILADSGEEVTPHMKVFWEQQRKLLAAPKFGRRYHPHIIRFCLSVHAKSPAAYKELRDSGVLVLPSERTLRDYRNFFRPKAGFHPENIGRLRDQTICCYFI